MIVHGAAGRFVNQNKYRAQPTIVEGIRFASKREAKRWRDLQLLETNREVRNIRRQVEYKLEVSGALICKYRADFVYEELRADKWSEIVEDVKGFKTPIYRLKRKLMKACHGIEIRET